MRTILEKRKIRRMRVGKKVRGTAARPRLSVHVSLRHVYGQIVNDELGTTLAFSSTKDPALTLTQTSNKKAAQAVGESLGKKAKEHGVEQVVFDRGGRRYHGVVEAFAQAVRSQGVRF